MIEQHPGVSLGRAFGLRFLHGHQTGFICRPPGPNRDMFACSGFPCASIDCNKNNKIQKKKIIPGRKHTLDIEQHGMEFSASD